jgi:hypothetical protein
MAPRQPQDPVVAAYRKMFQVKLSKQEIKARTAFAKKVSLHPRDASDSLLLISMFHLARKLIVAAHANQQLFSSCLSTATFTQALKQQCGTLATIVQLQYSSAMLNLHILLLGMPWSSLQSITGASHLYHRHACCAQDDLATMQRELKALRQASSSSDGSRGAPRYEAYPYQRNQMEL